MRIPKNISLDATTHEIASEMDDFSGWVRARLLAWQEDGHQPFIRHLQEVSTRRLVAILMGRLAPYGVATDADEPLYLSLCTWIAEGDQ